MSAIDLTFVGDPAELTLAPGDALWVRSTANPAALVRVDYTGDPASLVVALDTPSWGTAYTVTRQRPAIPGARPDHDGRMAAFRESSQAARRAALEREAQRQRHDPTFWSTVKWR